MVGGVYSSGCIWALVGWVCIQLRLNNSSNGFFPFATGPGEVHDEQDGPGRTILRSVAHVW